MTLLFLLTKIYNSHQLKEIDGNLRDLLGDLNIEAEVKGTTASNWVKIDILGEDEAVAGKLLERETGFCPIHLENVKKFASIRGYVTGLQKGRDELILDIGVFEPRIAYARVPLAHLQTHLAKGKKASLLQISESWGFCENLPLEIKVLEVNLEEKFVISELHANQIRKFARWKDSLLDRLIVIGASLAEVTSVIENEGLKRDVIDVEKLGMFEHALVCKLGTDAAGLIGPVGRRLRKAKFTVFNPKTITT